MTFFNFRDIFNAEEFVAAGVLNQEEEVIKGADGRQYKSRTNTIKIDDELTEAIYNNKDPTLPILEQLKLPNASHHNTDLPTQSSILSKALPKTITSINEINADQLRSATPNE